jgi:hypothetical protein
MQGLGGLLGLATVTLEALLSVEAAARSGFGLFFGVSFGWGHDDLLCLIMSSILDIKETMPHRVSISARHFKGRNQPPWLL